MIQLYVFTLDEVHPFCTGMPRNYMPTEFFIGTPAIFLMDNARHIDQSLLNVGAKWSQAWKEY